MEEAVSTRQPKISLPDLPNDIFVLVIDGLETWDIVHCQKVSKSWRAAFLNPENLRLSLKKNARSRGVHEALQLPPEDLDWSRVFRPIASRQFHLDHGTVRKLVKHKLNPLDQYGLWYPVGQWDYHESQPGGRLYYENAATHLMRIGNKPYLFRISLWSHDDGLIAFAPAPSQMGDSGDPGVLAILDIESGKHYPVPYDCRERIVRNIKLRNRALVVEWAEKYPYHDLNDNEQVHRHFATCYDITQSEVLPNGDSTWRITVRNEWKMHFLGLPLNNRDRFFSTHNGTHYAMYFWQPNRSMYTGDEDMPIEALSVWNIANPSMYRPSEDPTSSSIPADETKRPHLLARYSFRELDFIGVRQHANISFMSLSLDSQTCSLTIRENMCLAGQGYFDPAERLMQATATTFPFLGHGPARRQEWYGDLPPYRGHCSMESDDIEVQESWFLPVMDVYDQVADVRFSLVETCFTGNAENRLIVRVKSRNHWATMDDGIVKQVAAMGRIAGDERWLVGQNGQMELVILKF